MFYPNIHVEIYIYIYHGKYICCLVNTFYCYLSNDFTLLLNTLALPLHSMLIVNPILLVYILKFTLYLEEGNCFEVVKKRLYAKIILFIFALPSFTMHVVVMICLNVILINKLNFLKHFIGSTHKEET